MQRLSVLDAVKERYQMLNNQLGAEDRQRLEAHLSAVEAVENKIANFSSVDPGCAVPAVPNVDTGPTSIPQRGDAMMDLLVAALACDMTRVATLQWSGGVSGMVHHWLGHTEGHHDLSHQTSAQAQQQLTEINIWFAQQLASLIDRLKATPYGNGTLFDDVTILWCNELSDGKAHSHNPMAHVLAGSCGGYFNTGRFIDYPNMQQRQGDLMVSLLNAMDVPATTFGMPQYCSGPLPNLT